MNKFIDKIYPSRSAFESRPLNGSSDAKIAHVPLDFRFSHEETTVGKAIFALNRSDGEDIIDVAATPDFSFKTRDEFHLILDKIGTDGLHCLDISPALAKYDPTGTFLVEQKTECIVRSDWDDAIRCAIGVRCVISLSTVVLVGISNYCICIM